MEEGRHCRHGIGVRARNAAGALIEVAGLGV
jgi:hypothetical protein